MVKQHQQYLDKVGEEVLLMLLVEEYLDDDSAVRSIIATIYERIQVSKDAYMKDWPQDSYIYGGF